MIKNLGQFELYSQVFERNRVEREGKRGEEQEDMRRKKDKRKII